MIITGFVTAFVTKTIIMRRCNRIVATLLEMLKKYMDPEFCACGECDGEGHTLDEYYEWDGQWTEDNL
jgi:transcription initiation factor IIE alpha subunit